jgi:hypothetical protein
MRAWADSGSAGTMKAAASVRMATRRLRRQDGAREAGGVERWLGMPAILEAQPRGASDAGQTAAPAPAD